MTDVERRKEGKQRKTLKPLAKAEPVAQHDGVSRVAPSRVAPVPRVREGPLVGRPSSPAWDSTVVRVSRAGKERFELLRARLSSDGRIRPHWEVFDLVLEVAERHLRTT